MPHGPHLAPLVLGEGDPPSLPWDQARGTPPGAPAGAGRGAAQRTPMPCRRHLGTPPCYAAWQRYGMQVHRTILSGTCQ